MSRHPIKQPALVRRGCQPLVAAQQVWLVVHVQMSCTVSAEQNFWTDQSCSGGNVLQAALPHHSSLEAAGRVIEVSAGQDLGD